jgi:hypothetical protein
MWLPPFEKESLSDEYWSLWQSTKLPYNLELIAAKEEDKQDILVYKNKSLTSKISIKLLIKKLIIKYKNIYRTNI